MLNPITSSMQYDRQASLACSLSLTGPGSDSHTQHICQRWFCESLICQHLDKLWLLRVQRKVQQVAAQQGVSVNFIAYVTSVSLAASPPPPPVQTPACQHRFRHWCLDGSGLTGAAVTAITVGACIMLALVLASVVWVVKRTRTQYVRAQAVRQHDW